MLIREAQAFDIIDFNRIRNQHTDNALPSKISISENCYINYLTKYGKGWVAIQNNLIIGYIICSKKESSIWALFVDQQYHRQGIGSSLLAQAIQWLNQNGINKIYLSTGQNTQAEQFYQKHGWQKGDLLNNGQVTYIHTRLQ